MILSSDEVYKTKILGFGEIYEEVSTNRQLKRITKKYGRPMNVLVLSKCGKENIEWSEKEAEVYRGQFLEFISCDNPVWKCAYANGSVPTNKHRSLLLLSLSRYIFYFLCPIFEYNRSPNLAHNKIGVLKT